MVIYVKPFRKGPCHDPWGKLLCARDPNKELRPEVIYVPLIIFFNRDCG